MTVMENQEDERRDNPVAQGATDSLAVAPPPQEKDEDDSPRIRHGMDASDVKGLRHDPSDEDAKLEVALDETFPGSDAPSNTQPGKGKDPAPSSGYDEEAEANR